jgi:hypothetical protein
MKRTRVHLLLLCLVLAFVAMAFAGTASAGWTWDDGGAPATDVATAGP